MDEYPFEYLTRAQRVDRFTSLVVCAQDGEAFTITRDGKPIAVVIGIEEYERLSMTGVPVAYDDKGQPHVY